MSVRIVAIKTLILTDHQGFENQLLKMLGMLPKMAVNLIRNNVQHVVKMYMEIHIIEKIEIPKMVGT
jgi:hypothetical protein